MTIQIYGDLKYRNKKCPKESTEQITFVNRIRSLYPDTYGRIIVHPENEGQLIRGQFSAINKSRAMGQTKGASDIIIPGLPAFVCELKRQDSTLNKPTQEQIEYLEAAQKCGAFVCIAYGCDAATEAFNHYLDYCILIKSTLDYKKTVDK